MGEAGIGDSLCGGESWVSLRGERSRLTDLLLVLLAIDLESVDWASPACLLTILMLRLVRGLARGVLTCWRRVRLLCSLWWFLSPSGDRNAATRVALPLHGAPGGRVEGGKASLFGAHERLGWRVEDLEGLSLACGSCPVHWGGQWRSQLRLGAAVVLTGP